jgi:hypothetical protein
MVFRLPYRIWCLLRFASGAVQNGGAGESRTPDLRFRKPPLYPSELQPRHQNPVSLHPFRKKLPNIPNRVILRNRGGTAVASCT